MKPVHQFIAIVLLLLTGCKSQGGATQDEVQLIDQHKELVSEFQDGQERFMNLVAEIRDEESFDAAKPSLDRVVLDWKDTARSLRNLEPLPEIEQLVLRSLIKSGHERTEPSGRDLMAFVSIENREDSALAWLEEFAAAGHEVGIQLNRLYGSSGYGESGGQSSEPILDSGAIIGTSMNSRLFAPPQGEEKPD